MNRAMREPSAGGERTKINKASQILSPEENDLIFTLLGRKCQSLSTAVVQIFKTEGAAHSHWKKKHTAVLCFVKDSSKRSYFLRAYCLVKNEKCWEHEVYNGMKLSKSRPYLITFEGHDGNFALNFASPDECEEFYSKADTIIETRNRKKQDRLNRPKSTIAPPKRQAPSVDQADDSKVILRNNPNNINSITFNAPLPQPAKKPTNIFGLTKNDKKGKKSKEKIISKTDISGPTNFIHIQHVGWDAQKGFDLNLNEADEDLKSFFNKAGVSENELKDRETREFIYDFIQTNNVLKPKVTAAEDKAPPPPPLRHPPKQKEQAQLRTPPPPPPPGGRQKPPPPPLVTLPSRSPPIRPPAIQVNIPPPAPMAPPPPPPPPPPMAPPPPPMPTPIIKNECLKAPPRSVPAVQIDSRSELMESIRKGAHTLKKVDLNSLSTGSGDSRSDLMSEIRHGIELKPIPDRTSSDRNSGGYADGAGTDDLAAALRRALDNKSRAIHSTDDESSDDDYDPDEWDD